MMGLEWHERRRDKYGRFAARKPPAPEQLHIRCTEAQAQKVRRAALAARQDVGLFIMEAVLARIAATKINEDGDPDGGEAAAG